MDDYENVVEQFYGVYLLYCENPKYLGRTYIGFTVNPERRLKQHNKGKDFGGAWRTSNRGPWKMVLIVHGFPNDIAALRFEWAWQNPRTSRRLRNVPKKKYNEKIFDYCIRVLSEMLRTGPWNRLPLTIRWIEQEYIREFPVDKLPPMHMPFCYEPVVTKKITSQQESSAKNLVKCYCCQTYIDDEKNKLTCLIPTCNMSCHFICLANLFLEVGEYVPIEGNCPKCNIHVLWGDLVKKSKGCYKNLAHLKNMPVLTSQLSK